VYGKALEEVKFYVISNCTKTEVSIVFNASINVEITNMSKSSSERE
jgi:hypothetical protein